MRIAVTGAGGFVGPWVIRDVAAHGHEAVGDRPGPDVTDAAAVAAWLDAARPDAVVHLASESSPRRAAADPERALAINVGGTRNLLDAAIAMEHRPIVLIAGSVEVYGAPEHLPLTEDAPLHAASPYSLSKVGQEAAGLDAWARHSLPVVVSRSFHHTGPGQLPHFAVPGIAGRVAAVAAGLSDTLTTGNLDVARDFLDVRDVARAYRLLLEGVAAGRVPGGTVVNVCSGRSVSIRTIVEILCRLAGVVVAPVTDPSLVRMGEPPEIRGDPSRLVALTGWAPSISLEETLAGVLDDARAHLAAR